MIPRFAKALRILRNEGPTSLARRGLLSGYYRGLRPHLPWRKVRYNSKSVRSSRLFDELLLSEGGDRPNYESGIINSLRTWVREGDDVVIIGGGWGVTAVVAAEAVGEAGNVHVFEGAANQVEHVKETAELNGVSDRVTVTHGIVGDAVDLRGKEGDATLFDPTEIPDCDVLELDCEGSEQEILKKLVIHPRVAIVETHGMYDSPPPIVERLLERHSYHIVSKEVADLDKLSACLDNEIFVVTGVDIESL